jgi:hypothetical protein
MPTDIIPQSYENLYHFLGNLDTKIQTHGAALGMSAADISAFRAKLAPWIAKLKAVLDAQHALDLATGQAQQESTNQIKDLRRRIQNWKTSDGYDDGIGADLEIIASGMNFDPLNYQPEITSVESFPGYVRIKGKKLGADSVNVYARLKGEAEFKLIASRKSRFPFDDDRPLAVSGTPEVREYEIRGVLNDEEIGQPSARMSLAYAG